MLLRWHCCSGEGLEPARNRPEKTEVYRLSQDHFDSYVPVYEERFEPRSGPFRAVVVRSVEEFLSCGRIRCPVCRAEHLFAFSCRTRGGLCSSCLAKRAVLFAEKPTSRILASVPHRYSHISHPALIARTVLSMSFVIDGDVITVLDGSTMC